MYNLNHWVNWREEHRPGAPKPAKVPTCGNPHDPTNWLPYALAAAIDPAHIGFVLTANDPYFCIDLDHAWDGREWSALSSAVLSMFPGAYVEISYSGDGLHIIGRGALPPGYSTRGVGVECYTDARFIAITGTHAAGDPDTDCSAALSNFAVLYLKPANAPVSGEWTSAPVPDHTPIPDDNDLIRRMLTARVGAGVAFGGKASPNDLWTGNVAALADAWPSQTDEYDRSAADAALAAHLAFWTGKDCERIERLMRLSALVRPKWDRRGDDYLKRTIIGAAARCSRVYIKGKPLGDIPVPTGEGVRSGFQYLDVTAQQRHFAGCVYITSAHRVLVPNGMLLKPDQFKAAYGGYEFQIATDGGKPSKNAFEVFTESRAFQFPKADLTCFRPEYAPGTIINEEGLSLVNTYVPAVVVMTDGDVTPWLDLMSKLLPNESDRAIIIAYLAALRQYPGIKFRWCPLIQGVEGNGKGIIMSTAEYIVGQRYTHKPSAKELGDSGSKFTGWIDRRLLILIEEIYVSDRRELLDALKPLIADDRVEIQHKGADQVTGENRANFILTSNHLNAITKTANDRRYGIFYTAQQDVTHIARDGMDGDYLPNLWQWLRAGGFAAVAGYLNRYTIPDAINPATRCHRAPWTSSTAAAIEESRGVIEQEIMQAIEEGRPGFAGGWVSSVAVSRLLNDIRRNVPPRNRRTMMATLGYVPHPALTNGQLHTAILQEDMKRPILYVKDGSINFHNLTTESAILHNYMNAQGYAGARITAIT